MQEKDDREQRQGKDDERNPNGMTELVNGVPMAAGIARYPFFPSFSCEHKTPKTRALSGVEGRGNQ